MKNNEIIDGLVGENLNKKIKLKASARLVHQLGEQLISSELVALMELIKNSYDADATTVIVRIDTKKMTPHGRGEVTIEDNGHGMVPSIIENAFYKLSTTHKTKHTLSLGFKRLSLGNKGLGRLAFQRLGYFIDTITRPNYEVFIENNLMEDEDFIIKEKYNEFQLKIDWSNLEADIELSELVASYEKRFSEKSQGTHIKIEGLRNPDFWNLDNKQFNELIEGIYSMTNPYNSDEIQDKFKIKIYLNDQKIENTEFNQEIIESMSKVNYHFSLDNDNKFKININYSTFFIENYIENIVKNLEKEKFKIIEKSYNIDNFKSKEYVFDLSNKSEITKSNKKILDIPKLQLSYVQDNFASPGSLHGAFYFFPWGQNDKKSYKEYFIGNEKLNSSYSQFESLWKKIQGINVFRNGFRVLPYGQSDWLGFDALNRTLKYTPFGYNNITGYVSIDGKTSQNLRETTSREGFIHDEYGSNFFKLIKDLLLKVIFTDFNNFRLEFDYKVINSTEVLSTKNGLIKFKKIPEVKNELEKTFEESRDANENLKKIIESSQISETEKIELQKEINKVRNANENIKTLHATTVESQSQILKLKDMEREQIKDVLPMVGQSIILEALTHELHRIKNNIEINALESIKAIETLELSLRKDIDKKQRHILTDIRYLGEQLLHIEPTYKKRKAIIEEFNLKSFLTDMYIKDSPLQRKAENKKVKINISGTDLIIKANKGFITTVFDNLFLNSLYWIEQSNEDKFINFEISKDGEVIVYDSGNGIDKTVEQTLFEPFITQKVDGRGLGLYIVHSLLEDTKATIKLLDERKNGNKYKFLITFTEFENKLSLFNI